MPFWFKIIEQWREMGKGEYGVTFPFLAGAIARTQGKNIDHEFVVNMFQNVIDESVSGYYCEVRWCNNIDEPVASVKKSEALKGASIKSHFCTPENESVSLAFTTDLMSMFNLYCTTSEECLAKLIDKTEETIRNGGFSKNSGQFTDFTESDIEYIEKVSAL